MQELEKCTTENGAAGSVPGGRELWVLGPRRLSYQPAWELQKRLLQARLGQQVPDCLLLLEHPPVYTIGRRGGDEHLLITPETLQALGAEVYHIDRGGDITYHGPGQLVGYPILDLSDHKRDVHWYLRKLEQVLVDTLAHFGIASDRVPGRTGVWVDGRKIAAIGIKISRWITMHGFALNVNTDLKYFDYIVPCGLQGVEVTSVQDLLQRRIAIREVAGALVREFAQQFHLEPSWVEWGRLAESLHTSVAG